MTRQREYEGMAVVAKVMLFGKPNFESRNYGNELLERKLSQVNY